MIPGPGQIPSSATWKTLPSGATQFPGAVVETMTAAVVNSRDALGRWISASWAGITWTRTYGPNGVATESGNGTTKTYNYDASGKLTSTTVA